MNHALTQLQPYPFAKLADLIHGITPPKDLAPIDLSIGEPQHQIPSIITAALNQASSTLGHYPSTRGSLKLRRTISAWLIRRYGLPAAGITPEKHVLPVNGTREALFAIAQTVVDRNVPSPFTTAPIAMAPIVIMPDPCYQIYEGAALLAGATPWYVPCLAEHDFAPDYASVPADIWQRCQLLYLCSPGNPTGLVLDFETLAMLIEHAERFDFIIAADECYSEIYRDEQRPPMGLLEAAMRLGSTDLRRCLVFHSLSKRSNAPGLRSGYVAGDKAIIEDFFIYRTYHGCAMPPHHQSASIAAWNDEDHVRENRAQYRAKFTAVLDILKPVMEVYEPPAGFYLWPKLKSDDTIFTRELYQNHHVKVLPGSLLGREIKGINPGSGHIRMALVAPLDVCVDAAHRIRTQLASSP